MNGQSALGMMNAGDIVVLVDSNSTHKDASITVVKEVIGSAPIRTNALDAISISELATLGI